MKNKNKKFIDFTKKIYYYYYPLSFNSSASITETSKNLSKSIKDNNKISNITSPTNSESALDLTTGGVLLQ